MAASDAVLLLGGLAFGLAGMPVMIVALASACIVASNLLVLRLNEPLIGLGTARVAPAGGAWRMTPTPSSKIAKNMPETPEQAVCILEMAMSDDGHRAGYFALLNQLYPTRRAAFTWRAALTRQPVLVPMIEEAFGRYVAVCLLRGLLGRRTVGFLFRPKPALEGRSWRLRAKRWSLRALRQLPSTRTLTILPFSVEPAFATIADEWIYDFEMWDMVGNGQNSNRDGGPLAAEILLATKGRKVCCSIGRQDASKGFDQFSQAYQSAQDLRAGMLFAFGGKVAPALASCAADFAASGGFARARFITDAELLDFYACADLVWCVYAPDYDQASGILGRAMQLGIPVVVRKGSLIQRLCEIEKQAHIAFDETTDPAEFLRLAGHKDPAKGAARALSYRAESLRRLSDALGVMPRMGLG